MRLMKDNGNGLQESAGTILIGQVVSRMMNTVFRVDMWRRGRTILYIIEI